jgi:hypothetical protein
LPFDVSTAGVSANWSELRDTSALAPTTTTIIAAAAIAGCWMNERTNRANQPSLSGFFGARREASCMSRAETDCGGSYWNVRIRLCWSFSRVPRRSSSAVRSVGWDSRCVVRRASSAGVSSP